MSSIFSVDDPALAQNLQAGQVGVLPTDTVYGVVARAAIRQAVTRLYKLKNRERKPGTLLAANIEQLITLGLPEPQLRAAAHLWPNPLSLVMACGPELEYLHQGVGSLAVRIPADAKLRRLLEQTGPLLTSSANQPGEPPAEDIAAAREYFGERADFYADGGSLAGRQPSTVARLANGRLEILRQGAATIAS